MFSSGAAEYSVRDVIDAAHFRGEIAGTWNELLKRVDAEQRAIAAGDEVQGTSLDEAAVAFRYQYDLITAEETEAWLEARGVSLADFSDYFSRQYWGKAIGRNAAPVPFGAASMEQRELLAAELTLSGELDQMAARLAWRVAARKAAQAEELEAPATEAEEERFRQRHNLETSGVADWLSGLERDRDWLDEMLALEASYRARCEALLTPEMLHYEISAVRLPMTRLDLETIELESRDAANEALMCVRDDGMTMEEVAREGRYPYRRAEVVLEEIPDDLQQRFLSLTPGSTLEPTPRDDGFVLSRLLSKHEPSADDPSVRARLEQRILARHFSELSANYLQWQILPNLPE